MFAFISFTNSVSFGSSSIPTPNSSIALSYATFSLIDNYKKVNLYKFKSYKFF